MKPCQFEVGDIIFYETESFFGKVIRKVTKHKHSHVAMIVGDNMVVESVAFRKSRLVPLLDTKFKRIRVMRPKKPLTDKQKERIVSMRDELTGIPYDYKGIFLLFLQITKGKDLSEITSDISRMWCSELVLYMASAAGINLVPHINNYMVDIKELEESPYLHEVAIREQKNCFQ